MRTVVARQLLPGASVDEAARLWFDLARWPSIVDGFGTLSRNEGAWPHAGARIVWDSLRNGRGRVVEHVLEYEPGVTQLVRVEDPQLTGTQRVTFGATDAGGVIRLELDLRAQARPRARQRAGRPVLRASRPRRRAAPDAPALRGRAAGRPRHDIDQTRRRTDSVFVFKAAVVGAGTMGGEIAQVIASAGIPVVLKDVRQEFVDVGLKKAEEVTRAQLGGLVHKQKISSGAGRPAGRRHPRTHHRDDRVRGLRRRRLRRRGRARADGDQAGGVRRARRAHAGPRDPRLEHLGAADQRDGRRDLAPRQGRRLSLLLSRVVHASRRGRRGRRHVARDDADRDDVRADDPQAADRLRRGAGLRRQPHPQLGDQRDLARPGGATASRSRRSTTPCRPRASRRWGRSS